MALHNFTLVLSGVNADTEGLEDALYNAGCDDALICFYGKTVYLEFDREASSLDNAISSAIQQIETASTINTRVESIDSSLVGLSDIAELANLSRQAIALFKDGARGKGDFPNPIQRIKGQSPLWSWAEVAAWLVKSERISPNNILVKNADTIEQWNIALRTRASHQRAEIAKKIQFLESVKCL